MRNPPDDRVRARTSAPDRLAAKRGIVRPNRPTGSSPGHPPCREGHGRQERTTRKGGNARNATVAFRAEKAASKGNEAQGRTGRRVPRKRCTAVRTLPRSKDLRDSEPSVIGNSDEAGNGSVGTADDRGRSEVREGNGRGDTVRLREGGVLRGVREAVRGSRDRGDRHPDCQQWQYGRGRSHPGRTVETHRTPGSAAGCNKPASRGCGVPTRS